MPLGRKCYQRVTLPKVPSSRVALMFMAWKMREMVFMVRFLPFSIFEIWALWTPIRVPSSSWVMFWARRAFLMASPIRKDWMLESNSFLFMVPSFPMYSFKISSSV